MGDLRQSENFAQYLSKIGWGIESLENFQVFVKKFPLLGSVIKIQRPYILDNQNIEKLRDLRKKYRTFQIIIEPGNRSQELAIKNYGFKPSKSPYLPSKTLHLDLTKSKKQLFNQLKKDTKYSLRKSTDLRIYSVNKTKAFRDSWKKSVGSKRWVPPKKYLDALMTSFKNNYLFLVTPNGNAGAIFLHAKNTAYYWQAFSSKKGRELHAQHKIVWAGILWAKDREAKAFDFEGIYDPRFPNKAWLGFTHFKKSFGGHEIEYPGAFTKLTIPIK
jgi:lipid II:glycine glycyltransferase (peptidoglycan interpeptide bridge formation enzyme)